MLKNKIAPVAQLDLERTATNREVGGSSPSRGAKSGALFMSEDNSFLDATILSKMQAKEIYDFLNEQLEWEECFAHDTGESGCTHCRIVKLMSYFEEEGL